MAIRSHFGGSMIFAPGGSYIVPQPSLAEREKDLRMDYESGRTNIVGIGHIHDDEEMRKATAEMVARLRKEYKLD